MLVPLGMSKIEREKYTKENLRPHRKSKTRAAQNKHPGLRQPKKAAKK